MAHVPDFFEFKLKIGLRPKSEDDFCNSLKCAEHSAHFIISGKIPFYALYSTASPPSEVSR